MEFGVYVFLPSKIPELIVVVLHRVSALLREPGRYDFVANDCNAANPSPLEVRHLCHMPSMVEKFLMPGGEREVRN